MTEWLIGIPAVIAFGALVYGVCLLIERISESDPTNTRKLLGIVLWSIPLVGGAAATYVLVEVMLSPTFVDDMGKNLWKFPAFLLASAALCIYSVFRIVRFLRGR